MVQCDPHPIFRVRKGHNEGLKAFKLAVSTSRQVLQSVLYIFNLHIQVSYTCNLPPSIHYSLEPNLI